MKLKSRFFQQGRTFFLRLVLAAEIFFGGCSEQSLLPEAQPLVEIPAYFPPLPIPTDNPLNTEKVELGKRLFYDARLSMDGTVSCGSCHKQERAFTDGLTVGLGVGGRQGFRNTPTIINTAYLPYLSWEGRNRSLEAQSLAAMLNQSEMRADTAEISAYVANSDAYRSLFIAAFGKNVAFSAENVAKAIASFMRTILSASSRYDRFIAGDSSALSLAEQRGLRIFFTPSNNCIVCHSGFDFSDGLFHNTAIYKNYLDRGRFYVTGDKADFATFKTPTLRNIALTAPYMHDGHFKTLEEVVEHYNKGGVAITFNRNDLIKPLDLSESEQSDLVAFLRSLTDERVIKNPAFSAPR